MIYFISTFVGSMAYLLLALFIYKRVSLRTREVNLFLLICLGWSIYNLSLTIQFIARYYDIEARELVLVCMNISNTVGGFVVVIFVDFLLTFAGRRPKIYWLAYLVEAIITPVFIRWEWINDLIKGETHYYPPPYHVAPLLTIFFFIIAFWGLISLRLACRNTDSPIRRQMLRFLFWGSILLFPAAVSDMAFMLRNVGYFPFSTVVGLAYVMYFSYAIVKYRFLGIRIAIRKGIIYIALTAPITTFFFVSAMTSFKLIPGIDSIPLVILWALAAAIVFYLIRERLEVFIDRVMFRKSYQYQRSLEQLDRDIMNEVDPVRFVNKLSKWLEESLKLRHVEVFLLESAIGEEKQYYTTVGQEPETYSRRIPDDSLLARCLRDGKETIFRADLPVLPHFREISHKLDKEFQRLSAEVCVPLMTERLLFEIDSRFEDDLNYNYQSISAEIREEFDNNRFTLSKNSGCDIKDRHKEWVINDKDNKQTYTIKKEDDGLKVYSDSKLSGIIVCGNSRRGKFEEEDRRLLGIAAYNIAFAVERAQLVLELKSANQFKWDLVRWLTHDLNTPLTPIKMIVEALRGKIGSDPEDQKAVSVVIGEITRLQSLISGLDFIADLDVPSSRPNMKYELIDLGNLVREVATLFDWQARENGISITCHIPSEISPVRGDANRLKQALANLISNGVKYNRAGGKVEITITQTDGRLVTSIVDTGIGISEAEISSIFNPFYRADNAQSAGKGGVGLGLAIVKRIVEEHGGDINIQSEMNVGTAIILSIPCESVDNLRQESVTGGELWKQKEAS